LPEAAYLAGGVAVVVEDDSVLVLFLAFFDFLAFFAFFADESAGLVSDFVSVEVVVVFSSATALKATRTNAASAAAIVRIIV
jgi:hypothetical protein